MTITALIAVLLLAPSPVLTAHAMVPQIEDFTSTSTISAYVTKLAMEAKISPHSVLRTLECESGMKADAIGDGGHSFGIAQIYLPAHREITKEQALDPKWAIDWTVKEFAAGHADMWTCYRKTALAGRLPL